MRFGAHAYVFGDGWSDDRLPVLDQARALGLECLEIGVGDDVHCTPERTRRRAEALGLDLIVSPGGAWPAACDLSAEAPADRAAGLAWHKRQVDLAAALGAVAYCGALYGHTGTVRKRRPAPDEYARTAEGLHHLAAYGAARGLPIVLEPMSHFRTHLINTPAQAARLIDLADHDNLRVLLDTYHLITEITDYAAGIRAVTDRLWGIHACENNRGVPGTGLVPWPAVFKTLRAVGFDGYILLETYNSSVGDFAYTRGMFHNVCPDAEAFVRQGLAFLKKGLAVPAQ